MGRAIRFATIVGSILCLSIPATRADDGPKARARPLILVHDMTWFMSKEFSGTWGWHWTMGRFEPDRVDATGKREIASHYYPLIGPYDSADPHLLEYQTLLMKIAGIDGAIADWYGNEDVNDYATIHRRTDALFDHLRRRGLKFAVCYEDRVLKAMAEKGKLTPAQVIEHARTHLHYCETNWFDDRAYVQWQGKPLLLVFGPDYLLPAQWEAAFSGMRRSPSFFTLHERRPPAVGSFAWPPMWKAKDGKLDAAGLDDYFDRYYGRDEVKIAGAFPGFRDIYRQAGVQPSHGDLDPRDGETFRHTLARAMACASPIVQIVTWNDFGEGTCVEPTREHGYRYLEAIQAVRRRFPDEPFPYRADDLRLPLRIYRLRERLARTSHRPEGP